MEGGGTLHSYVDIQAFGTPPTVRLVVRLSRGYRGHRRATAARAAIEINNFKP